MLRKYCLYAVFIVVLIGGCNQQVEYRRPTMGGEANTLAFTASTPGHSSQSFVYDGDKVSCISLSKDGLPANRGAGIPVVSPDGSKVVFLSNATNLLCEKDSGIRRPACFAYDVKSGVRTRLASIDQRNTWHLTSFPQIPLLFAEEDRNFVVLVFRAGSISEDNYRTVVSKIDIDEDVIVWEKDFSPSLVFVKAVSQDGSQLLFSAPVNNSIQLCKYNCSKGTTTIVSVLPEGYTRDIEDLFGGVAMSADGRYIAFSLMAQAPGSDISRYYVFLRDTVAQTTICISTGADRRLPNDSSGEYYVGMGANAQMVIFDSTADNLVETDTNKGRDIFLYNRDTSTTTLISVDPQGNQFPGYYDCGKWGCSVNVRGTLVAFSTRHQLYFYDTQTKKASVYKLIPSVVN